MDRQPAQAEASPSERCLLRQLVPVISPSATNPELVEGKSEAMIASTATVHDPHLNRPQLPEDHLSLTGRIEDANADFFD